MKLHNHVFTTSHIIGTTTFLFFFGRRQKGTRARTLNNEKRKGGLTKRSRVQGREYHPLALYGYANVRTFRAESDKFSSITRQGLPRHGRYSALTPNISGVITGAGVTQGT